MNNINIRLSDPQFTPNYQASATDLSLFYPCPTANVCCPYIFILPRGAYHIEAYGASGGSRDGQVSTARPANRSTCFPQENVIKYHGNTICTTSKFSPGAGGYISGTVTLLSDSQMYAHIGGSGEYGKMVRKGGYNGGGDANGSFWFAASGGGATDIRVKVNDLQHRIIVAGGGGGTDNLEGSGGSSGYPLAQGYWIFDNYYESKIASQTSGYLFGSGESGISLGDIAGAGGGWYGGFSSHSPSGGGGGGSSFILTKNAILPSLENYAFNDKSGFAFCNVSYSNGIWNGNGMIRITLLYLIQSCNCSAITRKPILPIIMTICMLLYIGTH